MMDIFDYMNLLAANIWLYGGTFLLVLGILVFVHEWGHYIVARLCGVRVETFSIGFGKEIFGINDSHGTRWKFSLFPLGGYVKLFGDVDPASAGHSEDVKDGDEVAVRPMTENEKKVAFFARPVVQRSAIVFAGPAINFIFAVVVLAGLYVFYGKTVTPPVAAAVVSGSAAERAGFLPNDEILSINGEEIRRFEDVRRSVMIALDTPMEFVVRRGGRDGEIITLPATPDRLELEDRFGFRHSTGMLGILGPLGGGAAFGTDTIRSVNGKVYEDRDELREALAEHLGSVFTISMEYGDGTTDKLIVGPSAAMNAGLSDPESSNYGALVIDPEDTAEIIKYGVLSGIREAVHETYVITAGTLEALGQMITGVRGADELGGIIRIGAMAGDMASTGFVALVTFTALLSINLGLLNLFPVPMLDGGHLLFYFLEVVKGSPVSERVQEYAFRLGLAILVGIMLFANLNDVVQLIR